MNDTAQTPKDIWDKLGVIFAVLTPLAVVLVGFMLNSTLEEQSLQISLMNGG